MDMSSFNSWQAYRCNTGKILAALPALQSASQDDVQGSERCNVVLRGEQLTPVTSGSIPAFSVYRNSCLFMDSPMLLEPLYSGQCPQPKHVPSQSQFAFCSFRGNRGYMVI
eukprot:234776-Amphidinium_carterae.1